MLLTAEEFERLSGKQELMGNVPDPMPEMDALIAATALVHELTLVTSGSKDLQHVGIAFLDPRTL